MASKSTTTKPNHLGYLFLERMKKHPDDICQIDAATGECETNRSVLLRSVRLARCLRNIGLQPGDVLSISGKNHLDIYIPFYAGLLNNLPISFADRSFKFHEIKILFDLSRPKVAFCQYESYDIYMEVIKALDLDTKVLTFDGPESNLKQFMETFDTNELLQDFKVNVDVDLDKIYAFLVSTSGTTGSTKLVALKHEDVISKFNMVNVGLLKRTQGPTMIMNVSSVHWFSGFYNAVALIFIPLTQLQTSNPDNFDHIIDMINKYKPVAAFFIPRFVSLFIDRKEDVDLSCLRVLIVGGWKIYPDVKEQFQALLHNDAVLLEIYGSTEIIGMGLTSNLNIPLSSALRPLSFYQVKLLDPDTGRYITEPNTTGELLIKGPSFSAYYNEPDETAKAYTADGYYKSGDLFYRDENDNYYYVDRLKNLIKSNNGIIYPLDVENVICTHPGVREVCVSGIPNHIGGELPVACVVTRTGYDVTSQDIHDLVIAQLSENSHLSGGVVFLDALPLTPSGKIARRKVAEMILKMKEELNLCNSKLPMNSNQNK